MLPNLVLAAMFTFYPAVMSWYFSFLDWSGFTGDREWVGLDNFRQIVDDEFFWNAYQRSLPVHDRRRADPGGAGVHHRPHPQRLLLQAGPLLPHRLLPAGRHQRRHHRHRDDLRLQPVQRAGQQERCCNTGMADRPVDFLGDPDTALWTVAAVWIWKWFGITMIYWLAALQVVPQDLYEAARIDGANRWHLHKDITLPMIAPFAMVIVLITVVGSLNVFGLVQTMTGGGPFFASEVMEVYIYRNAFGDSGIPRLGFASAAALFFGVTVIGISLIQGLGPEKGRRRPQPDATGLGGYCDHGLTRDHRTPYDARHGHPDLGAKPRPRLPGSGQSSPPRSCCQSGSAGSTRSSGWSAPGSRPTHEIFGGLSLIPA